MTLWGIRDVVVYIKFNTHYFNPFHTIHVKILYVWGNPMDSPANLGA